jgi:hypothetical protein
VTSGDPAPVVAAVPEEQLRWAMVLGIVLVFTVVVAVVPSGLAAALGGGLLALLVVAVVWDARVVPRWLRVANVMALVPAVVLSLVEVATDGDALTGWRHVAVAAVLATSTVAILHRIAQHRIVTLATVFGAVDAYVLLGLTFAGAYSAVEGFTGDLFAGPADGFDVLYFSFITLTTVGYGDLTPVSDVARSLAVVQALLGQVFLVVLVARTVSLLGQERPASDPPAG